MKEYIYVTLLAVALGLGAGQWLIHQSLKASLVSAQLDITELKRQNANLAAGLMELKKKDLYAEQVYKESIK